MSNNVLNGMVWDLGGFDFQIPYFGDTEKAVYVFKANLAEITWNCMRTLENNPSTLPQTATILKGQSVSGISIDDLLQVKNYGDGAKELVRLLLAGEFDLTEQCACSIHRFVGFKDALEWGVFRNLDISVRGVDYTPPAFGSLSALAADGFAFLKTTVADPKERAVALFLFMARSQFFFDANKRTSSLMMNGCLMQNGYWPITVLNRDSEEFHEKLGRFYETGNANEMMDFFARMVVDIYPAQEHLDHSKTTDLAQ